MNQITQERSASELAQRVSLLSPSQTSPEQWSLNLADFFDYASSLPDEEFSTIPPLMKVIDDEHLKLQGPKNQTNLEDMFLGFVRFDLERRSMMMPMMAKNIRDAHELMKARMEFLNSLK